MYSSELSAKLGLQVERKERRVRHILEYSNIFKQIILTNNVKLKGRRKEKLKDIKQSICLIELDLPTQTDRAWEWQRASVDIFSSHKMHNAQ